MRNAVCAKYVVVLAVLAFGAMGAGVRADQADDQFELAAGRYDSKQWTSAVDEFSKFLQQHPNDRRANECVFFLAEAEIQSGLWDDARKHFHLYLTGDSGGRHAKAALFRAGEAACLAGKYDVAKPDLEAFLEKYPQDRLIACVLPYLGDIAAAGGNDTAAIDFYRDGLKRFPTGQMQDECRMGLARTLERQKQNEEAERLYIAVAEKRESRLAADALFRLGSLQYAAGRFESALESFTQFNDRFADSPLRDNAKLGFSLTLLKLGRTSDAVELLDSVLAATSAGDQLHEEARRLKDLALADEKKNDAVDENRENSETAAIPDDRRKMIEEFWIVEADYQSGKLAEATAGFQRMIESIEGRPEPWTAMIYLRRAQSSALENRWDEAQSLAEKIAADFPTFVQQYEVDYLLGRCLANRGDFDAARKVYQRVLESPIGAKTETAAMAQWMIGDTFLRQKDFANARQEYMKVEVLYGYPAWQAGGLLQAGKCCERLGQPKEAAELYRRILNNYRYSTSAARASERLKSLEKTAPFP